MGHLLMVVFFVLACVAATGAMLSLLEVPVAIIRERFGLSRKKATLISLLILAMMGSTCALTNSTLAEFKLFGMTMFDPVRLHSPPTSYCPPVASSWRCLLAGSGALTS